MRGAVAAFVAVAFAAVGGAEAVGLTVQTVVVGNPGNPGDAAFYGGRIGGVAYPYQIGKYEVTAGQYTEFLNAVAASDPYALYNTAMYSNEEGCHIRRTGSAGNYQYTVASDWADLPVNYVGWGDAVRFANWLHNGQPIGPEGPETTENGSYALNGATYGEDYSIVTRATNATWVIPSEDEWYKAAYHKNDGVTGHYWTFPTCSDELPDNQFLKPDPGNCANFRAETYTLGGPYWRTAVGEFENSAGPYGTFDQGGNVAEWNDTALQTVTRGFRGGAYSSYATALTPRLRGMGCPGCQDDVYMGFRVGWVPEPSVMSLMLAGVVATARGARRRVGK